MKTAQDYINDYQEWRIRHYLPQHHELDKDDLRFAQVLKDFENAGFEFSQVWFYKYAVRLKYIDERQLKADLAHDIITIYPELYEMKFSSQGVYIR